VARKKKIHLTFGSPDVRPACWGRYTWDDSYALLDSDPDKTTCRLCMETPLFSHLVTVDRLLGCDGRETLAVVTDAFLSGVEKQTAVVEMNKKLAARHHFTVTEYNAARWAMMLRRVEEIKERRQIQRGQKLFPNGIMNP